MLAALMRVIISIDSFTQVGCPDALRVLTGASRDWYPHSQLAALRVIGLVLCKQQTRRLRFLTQTCNNCKM